MLAVAVFTALALWPLWSRRFPPMQDYPEQLFYTQGLAVSGDPAFDYDRYYEFGLHPLYSTFYVATLGFAKLAPFEVAGKLALSLYALLVALLVLRLARRKTNGGEGGAAPWGALLFFPFLCNQQYYFGNLNYLYSLPLLLLALLDLEDLLRGELRPWPVVRHALWQTALFVTHPLTFLVYGAMAALTVILHRRVRRLGSKVVAAAALALVFAGILWRANQAVQSSQGFGTSAMGAMDWLPLNDTLKFAALMFTGMEWSQGPDLVALALWIALAVLVVGAARAARAAKADASRQPIPFGHVLMLVLIVAAVLVLPFRVGTFSYINLRLTAVAYFVCALLASHVRFAGWRVAALLVLAGASVVDSGVRQRRVSAEVGEILPVVERIPPRSRILPLVFDRDSPELEGYWFDPHLHDHHYYHVVVGGGFNPYLFGSPLRPVRFDEKERRPSPGEFFPQNFSWQTHAADYQYFVVRGGPKQVADYFSARCNPLVSSGPWTLYERR